MFSAKHKCNTLFSSFNPHSNAMLTTPVVQMMNLRLRKRKRVQNNTANK